MTAYNTADLVSAIHTDNGDPEVRAPWVASHLKTFRLIDIREPHELTGPLGQIEDVENIPLLSLLSSSSLDAKVPLVLICRSGRRSALAARELASKGFDAVASVEGGMLAWNTDVWDKHDIHTVERTANAAHLKQATFHTNGIPEVGAEWVHSNLGRFRFIDVREPQELRSNGAVAQAENVPMQEMVKRASQGEFDRDLPLVVMCQSGGRSGRVTQALVGSGFTDVASMEGGMFGWRARGYPHT